MTWRMTYLRRVGISQLSRTGSRRTTPPSPGGEEGVHRPTSEQYSRTAIGIKIYNIIPSSCKYIRVSIQFNYNPFKIGFIKVRCSPRFRSRFWHTDKVGLKKVPWSKSGAAQSVNPNVTEDFRQITLYPNSVVFLCWVPVQRSQNSWRCAVSTLGIEPENVCEI